MGLKKYIVTGDIVEVYDYQFYTSGKGGARERGEATEESKQKNYANTNQRRRDTIRRLACCNFDNKYDKFLTLTFADNKTDVKECNVLFKAFIRKLREIKHISDLKYLAVIEFQQRGAVHYHVLLNIPYIPQEELQKLWGNGFVFINAIIHVDNIGAYIVKYMTKDNKDVRLRGQKAYLTSHNLKHPEKIINHNLKDFDILEDKLYKKYNLDKIKPVYVSNFDTQLLGHCEYKQYNLKRIEGEL